MIPVFDIQEYEKLKIEEIPVEKLELCQWDRDLLVLPTSSIKVITGRREDREPVVKDYLLSFTDFTSINEDKKDMIIDQDYLLPHERFNSRFLYINTLMIHK